LMPEKSLRQKTERLKAETSSFLHRTFNG
jgi:hypothetical protein